MEQYFGNRPDEGLDVEFYLGAEQDSKESSAKGYPVFKEVPWVRIKIPGNRDEIIDTVAWLDKDNVNSHLNRFPIAWARYQTKDSASGVSGFSLREWAGLTRAVVEALLHHNVRTVEQLASLTDGNIQGIPLPNMVALRQKAIDFLAQANSAEALRAELEALKAQMATLQMGAKVTVIPQSAEAAFLGAPTEAAQAAQAPAKRRGRRPKAKAEATDTQQ